MKSLLSLFFVISTLFSGINQELLQSAKSYIKKNYTLKTPKYEFKVKPSSLKIDRDFAVLNAVVTYEDGTFVPTEYIEDLVFVLCLKKMDGKWSVIYDLSRNDVPSYGEMKEIKREFPKEFPKKLLSKFWRDKFETNQIVINEKRDIVFEEDGRVLFKNRTLKDGKYEILYDDFVYLKFNIKNQKLEGLYEEYYDYYTIYSRGYYKDGKADGNSTNYYENGKKWFVQNYEDGKLKSQITYDQNGNIILKEDFTK